MVALSFCREALTIAMIAVVKARRIGSAGHLNFTLIWNLCEKIGWEE